MDYTTPAGGLLRILIDFQTLIAAVIAAVIATVTWLSIGRQARLMAMQANSGTAVHYMHLISGLNNSYDRIKNAVATFRSQVLDEIGRTGERDSTLTPYMAYELKSPLDSFIHEVALPTPVTSQPLNEAREATLKCLSSLLSSLDAIHRSGDGSADEYPEHADAIREAYMIHKHKIFEIENDCRKAITELLSQYDAARERAGAILGTLTTKIDNEISRDIKLS